MILEYFIYILFDHILETLFYTLTCYYLLQLLAVVSVAAARDNMEYVHCFDVTLAAKLCPGLLYVTLFDGLVLETSGIILLESQAVWVYFTSGSLYKDIPECEHVSHIHKTVVSGRFKIAGPAVVDTGLFNSFLT